jgi:outer membrane biosynthesis protein TonB
VVGGIAAVLCLLVYGLLQHLDGSARAGLPTQAEANAPAEVATQSNPSMGTPLTNPGPVGTDGSDPPATEPPQSMPDSVEPPPVEPPRVVVPHPKRKAAPPPPAPAVEVIMPTIPAPSPVAPPPPPKPAPPPSRETQLATAFAACTSPDALEKAICQQRARVDLCEGYWGLVPQCPARRESGS